MSPYLYLTRLYGNLATATFEVREDDSREKRSMEVVKEILERLDEWASKNIGT